MDRSHLPHSIEVDIADPLPVTDDELALIEAYMGAIIAAMIETELLESELSEPKLFKP